MKWIYLALLFCIFSTSCGKIEDPQFKRIEKFGIKNLGISKTTIGFSIVYFNPNSFGVTVKEASIDVYADSVYLGKFSQPIETAVDKKSEFAIPLEGVISFEKALQFDLPSLIGKEVTIRAEGSVRVGKAGVFINKEVRYAGKHRLDAGLLKNPAGAGFSN